MGSSTSNTTFTGVIGLDIRKSHTERQKDSNGKKVQTLMVVDITERWHRVNLPTRQKAIKIRSEVLRRSPGIKQPVIPEQGPGLYMSSL